MMKSSWKNSTFKGRKIFFLSLFILASCLPAQEQKIGGGASSSTSTSTSNLPLAVSSVSPTYGVLGGGDTITISGQGFQVGAKIFLGAHECTNLGGVYQNSSTLACITPPMATLESGYTDLMVVNPDSTTSVLNDGFYYRPFPIISSFTPNSANSVGGQTITILGQNFVSEAKVYFGGLECSSYSYTGDYQITCTLPFYGLAADVYIQIINPDGQNVYSSSPFSFTPIIDIYSVSPSAGPITGGTTLAISGDGLDNSNLVLIDGVGCPVSSYDSVNKILYCITPNKGSEALNLALTVQNNTYGVQDSISAAFSYRVAPTVTSITPTEGSKSGNDTVTISGTNFRADSVVYINGSICTAANLSGVPNSISCQTPLDSTPAGTPNLVDITVTNTIDGQTSSALTSAFQYNDAPLLTSVSPTFGPVAGGTSLTLYGNYFNQANSLPEVKVGANYCNSVTLVSATEMTCTIESISHVAGFSDIVLTASDGQSVTLSSAYEYISPPTISDTTYSSPYTPWYAKNSTAVSFTINGTNFRSGLSVAGATCSYNSSTQIDCSMTTGATTQALYFTVTNPDGQNVTSTHPFSVRETLTDPPVTFSKTYASTAETTSITITGSNFYPDLTVSFSGTSCSNPVVSDYNETTGAAGTTISCTIQSGHSLGLDSATITNQEGYFITTANQIQFVDSPTVTTISPTGGKFSALNGDLAITGTNFPTDISKITVTLQGTSSSLNCPVTASTGSVITCTSPMYIPSGSLSSSYPFDVLVTNTDLGFSSNANSASFTYWPAPILLSVSQPGGIYTGGDTITLSGSGFLGTGFSTATADPSVAIGSNTCTVSSVTTSSIECVTNATVSGNPEALQDIVITNYDGQKTADPASVKFSYNDIPTIVSVDVSSGPITGGSALKITGNNFTTDSVNVKIGTFNCGTITNLTSTTVDCVTSVIDSADVGLYEIQVTGSDNQVTAIAGVQFRYYDVPTVTSIVDNFGAYTVSERITITGTNLFSSGITSVDIGGHPCSINAALSSEPTSLVCDTLVIAGPVPAVSSTVDITITNAQMTPLVVSEAYTFRPKATISSIAPTFGPTTGTEVTITGENFYEDTSPPDITFGGTPCSNITFVSSTELKCTPTGTQGSVVDVIVDNPDGVQAVTLSSAYSFADPPTLSTLNRYKGSTMIPLSLTLTGTNLEFVNKVMFGSYECTIGTVNATTVTCTVGPLGQPTPQEEIVDVAIETSFGHQASMASIFTFRPDPVVSVVSPVQGNLAGVQKIRITGDFLYYSDAEITFVQGVNSATWTPNNSDPLGHSWVEFDRPDGSATFVNGTIDLTFKNTLDGRSDTRPGAYTYADPPEITSVAPTDGSELGGDTITITGTNLDFFVSANICQDGTYTNPNSTTITCTTKSSSTTGLTAILLTKSLDGQTSSNAVDFNYVPAPIVDSISPSGVPLNVTTVAGNITFTGSNFVVGNTNVYFDSVLNANCSATSTTQIVCTAFTASAVAKTVDVTVEITSPITLEASSVPQFTYNSPPVITGTAPEVSPNTSPILGGAIVDVFGDYFDSGASMTLGGTLCSSVNVTADGKKITCNSTPAHASGIVDIVVQNSDGQTGTLSSKFSYNPTPTITSVSPDSGTLNGGSSISIQGTNFLSATTNCTSTCTDPTVTIDGLDCTGVTFVSSTEITCITPVHDIAPDLTVEVTNWDGQSVSFTGYSYISSGLLEWQVGGSYPDDPANFGNDPSMNVANTFALKNIGDIDTGIISLNFVMLAPIPGGSVYWEIVPGSDNCTGFTLASNGTCTVQIYFNYDGFEGDYSASPGAYTLQGYVEASTPNSSDGVHRHQLEVDETLP